MQTVEIQLSNQAVLGLDLDPAALAGEMRLAAAVKWYEVGRLSQEIAAEVAGLSRPEFVLLLSRMRVSPMQESADEALTAARLLLGK